MLHTGMLTVALAASDRSCDQDDVEEAESGVPTEAEGPQGTLASSKEAPEASTAHHSAVATAPTALASQTGNPRP